MKLPERLQKALLLLLEQPAAIHQIDLPMREEGWSKMRQHFPQESGLYVVLSPSNKCLRVGIGGGKKGIFGRWFASLGAHYSSYKGTCSPSCKSYHYFYKQIEQRWTSISVVFLLYPNTDRRTLLNIEKLLIQHLDPVWEKRIDGTLLWSRATAENLPPLDVFEE